MLRPQAIDAGAENGTVTIRVEFRHELARAQGDKAFHGCVIASLIDLAGDAAVAVKIGRAAPTIDLRIDYMRPRVDIEILDTQNRSVALGRGTFSPA